MSLTRKFAITKTTVDVTQAVFVDETDYSISGNPARNTEAHYILIAKMDENQVLEFISNIDNTDPLNKLEYSFINSIDGAYRLICFIPAAFDNGTTYTGEIITDGVITTYADIVWDSGTGKFYKALGTNFSGQPVTDTIYWEESPDFTTQVSNDKVTIFIEDDIITFRFEDCEVSKTECAVDKILCGLCVDLNDLFPLLSQQLVLDGANSENWQDKATKAEIVIVQGTKKFCC